MRENDRWAKTVKQYDAMALNEANFKLKYYEKKN